MQISNIIIYKTVELTANVKIDTNIQTYIYTICVKIHRSVSNYKLQTKRKF